MSDPSEPIHLHFRLSETDVRHYCTAGRARKCWRCCRARKAALFTLLAVGAFLVGTTHQARGVRSIALLLGTTAVVVGALAWDREARVERRIMLLARTLGLPREVDLVVSPEGIVEGSADGSHDPSRTYTWDEVLEIYRIDHLSIFQLRPAGGVLIVPDGAFASPEDRLAFEEHIRAWRLAGSKRGLPTLSDLPGSAG
jgi:hypothetical protein